MHASINLQDVPSGSSRIFYCIFIFFSVPPAGRTQNSFQFDFNADCRKAYEEIIKLKLQHREINPGGGKKGASQ